MRILILGGTHFVGRAVALAALQRGHDVTLLNRGRSTDPSLAVPTLVADRNDPAAVRTALADSEWDLVVDTWSGAPRAVSQTVEALGDRVAQYAYISSRSVYAWPIPFGADESAPIVEADPDGEAVDYSADKRGGELAVLRGFPSNHLIARPGIILGPDENIGRLPYWLDRLAHHDRVLAPAPADRPLQYVDARDLAAFVLDGAERGLTGCYDTVSARGHATTGELIAACAAATGSKAEVIWADECWLTAREITGWVDLPIWSPLESEVDALHGGDTSAALAAGLVCRSIEDTAADTWAWLQQWLEAHPGPPRSETYLDRQREEALIEEWLGRG